jgi:hypothetical protein
MALVQLQFGDENYYRTERTNVSQAEDAPNRDFANSLGEATARLNDAIDTTLDRVRGASAAEASAVAQRALDSLRRAKEDFDAEFAASLMRLEEAASGSHEPVPH